MGKRTGELSLNGKDGSRTFAYSPDGELVRINISLTGGTCINPPLNYMG